MHLLLSQHLNNLIPDYGDKTANEPNCISAQHDHGNDMSGQPVTEDAATDEHYRPKGHHPHAIPFPCNRRVLTFEKKYFPPELHKRTYYHQ